MSSEQKKVLEDIQRTKRLLKEGAAVSHGIHTSTPSTVPIMMTSSSPVFPSQTPSGIGDMMFSPGMRNAKQVLSQANMTSFGYFIPQDSHFGNSILPVLPRMEPTPGTPHTSSASSTVVPSSAASASSGNGQ